MYLQLNAILNRTNHPIAKSTTMHSPSFKAITFMLLGLMVLTSCRKSSYREAMSQFDQEGLELNKERQGGLLIVKKNQVSQKGEATEETEYYVRASSQDYFIKFCESYCTRRQFESMLSCDLSVNDMMHLCSWKGSYRVKQGALDHCEVADSLSASRIGYYAVLIQD